MPFIGSEAVQNSGAGNYQVIPDPPARWANNQYKLKSFAFLNEQECNVSINGSDTIYLEANQGLTVEIEKFDLIESFVIVDAGVDFQWIGIY